MKPVILTLDVKNFSPFVKEELALPAIKEALQKRKLPKAEIETVLSGLKLIRGGSFFKWKSSYWQQINGYAVGGVDSCDCTDLAMAGLLSTMLPAAEASLLLDLQWFKIYRIDSLCVLFTSPSEAICLQQLFQWYTVDPSRLLWVWSSSGHLPRQPLSRLHRQQDWLEPGLWWTMAVLHVWIFQDAHAHIAHSSCTAPRLNSEGISAAKTFGMRLRYLRTKDADILSSLNNHAGYLVARGYQEQHIKYKTNHCIW